MVKWLKQVVVGTCLVIILFSFFSGISQTQISSRVISLKKIIEFWEQREKVKIFYKSEWVQDIMVSESLKEQSLNFLLEIELPKNDISFLKIFNGRYILLFKGQPPTFSSVRADTATLVQIETSSNDTFTLSGFVKDALTEESIVGASIYAEQEGKGVVTDNEGYFILVLTAGVQSIRITAVGKSPTFQKINLEADQKINFEMYEQATQLDNVIISSEGLNRNVSSVGMSQVKIDVKAMKSIPPFMGEVDVIKSILLLPGVSTVGEGASGFNVRGGNVDQNLILLDETPLFNSSHLFGFFSTFNSDFLKDVTLIKGGIPATYGGRISSVLDVKMREGNSSKFSGTGGVGIISSRLLLEGPLYKNKTTFIIGGRYAYPNWILKKVPNLNVQKSSSYFYDLNFKLRHQINDKNSLHLSAYQSEDEFKFAADTTYGWKTSNASLKWSTLINQNLVANVTAVLTKYSNVVKGIQSTNEFNAQFGIETQGGKADFTYFLGENKIDFGASITRYTFRSGNLNAENNSSINSIALPDEFSLEKGIYASNEFKINDRISMQTGIRYSHYSVLGSAEVLIFDPLIPRSNSSIIDTLRFSNGETVKNYSGWEPRWSSKVSLSNSSSIKISYNKTYQYLQLLSNTTAVSPLDLWKTSNYNIKPQMADQVAIGYFRNFKENTFEFSVEAYYKRIENMIEYKDGANLFLNPGIEAELLNAKGKAYGIEIMTRKNNGKLTGWISYTYSRTLRKVKGTAPQETINSGKWYPSNFDKPNDLTLVGTYAFTKRLSLSANFTYSTGRPITYPQSVYIIDGYSFAQFSERNQGRIPDYHRLDLSFTIEESLKRTKKWKGSWVFSVYNLYGRKNPYSVFFKPQYKGNQTQAYQLAVIGTLFPSITYNFKF
jgi:hypothetical protein